MCSGQIPSGCGDRHQVGDKAARLVGTAGVSAQQARLLVAADGGRHDPLQRGQRQGRDIRRVHASHPALLL